MPNFHIYVANLVFLALPFNKLHRDDISELWMHLAVYLVVLCIIQLGICVHVAYIKAGLELSILTDNRGGSLLNIADH